MQHPPSAKWPSNSAEQRERSWTVPLIGAGFTAVSLLIAWLTIGNLILEGWQVSDWVETPAYIMEADLIKNRSDGTTTYGSKARYHYTFADGHYQSTRVSLYSGTDNVGEFHQRIYEELSSYRRSEKPFRCYVNPDNPRQAILYRDVRWGMLLFDGLFVIIFAGIGLSVMIAGLKKGEKIKPFSRSFIFPTPEAEQPAWQGKRISAGSKSAMLGKVAFAVIWHLFFVVPALFNVYQSETLSSGSNTGMEQWIALSVFTAIGLLLIGWAAQGVMRRRKFGNVELVLDHGAGVAGAELRATIEVPVLFTASEGITLHLKCIKRVTSGAGKSRKTRSTVLWESEQRTGGNRAGQNATHIPVFFTLPADAQATDKRSLRHKITWKLSATAEVPGVDFAVSFEVPVLRGDTSTPHNPGF